MTEIIKFNPDGSRVRSLDQRIADLYEDGYSLREIKRELRVAFGETRRALLRQGVRLRKPGTKPYLFSKKERRNIIALYKDGYSAVQIAEKYNTSHTTIYRMLRKAGVERRSRGSKGRKE